MRFHFPVSLNSLTSIIDDESSDAEPDVHKKPDAKNLVPSESSRTLTSGGDSTSGSDSDSDSDDDGKEASEVKPKQVAKKVVKPTRKESSSEESSDSESSSTSSSENESSDSESDSTSSMEVEEEVKVGHSSAPSCLIIIPKLGSSENNYEGQGT